MNVSKINIICPKASEYHAILMNDYADHEQMMIVYGYIRSSLKQFDGIIAFPCNDIINLVVKWYGREIIYLKDIDNQKSLYRLSLYKILQ